MTDVTSGGVATAPRPDEARKQRVHRALSSPVRQRIVELLSGDDAPLDADQLARRVALHRNTVRSHLSVLEEAELVASEPEQRDRPGRPRLLYRSTDATPVDGGQSGYRFLAEVLAGQLAALADDPADAAQAAGAAWGRYLMTTPSPSLSVSAEAAIARIVELLAEFGFAPERADETPDAPRMLLRRCPFLEVAEQHPDVVCSIHLGLMRGALSELRAGVEVTDLVPFADDDLCVAHLRITRA